MVDIAILAIIGLAMLIGAWKGVGKQLISLVCFLLAIVACYFLADVCLKYVLEVEVIRNLALGESFSLRAVIGSVVSPEAEGVVKFLYEPIMERYATFSLTWDVSPDQFLSVVLSLHLFTLVLSVLIFIAARIIASIVGYILKIIFLSGDDGVKPISRIFGAVCGIVKGAAITCVLLFIVSAIFPFGFSKVVTDELDKSYVAPTVSEKAFEIGVKNLYSDQTIELMLESAGFNKIVTE